MSSFQLTSSQGGWQPTGFRSEPISYFNSHPHKEDDIERGERSMAVIISTHILTRRMTESYCYVLFVVSISTHILTRRMTTDWIQVGADLIFQLTSSQGGWRGNFSFGSDQLKLFQLTSSRGGWQKTMFVRLRDFNFNSHPHEEDDMFDSSTQCRPRYFNSHPHEEDDLRFISSPIPL